MTDSSCFALALLGIDGLGRVTANRLLKHFARYEDLLACPQEQILARLKGAPRAEALVRQLRDREAMGPRLAEARTALEALAQQSVTTSSRHDPSWPAGLDALPRARRPVLLYHFGTPAVLAGPTLALFAHPPISVDAFEQAQDLARHVLAAGGIPVTGASQGFDVVLNKIAATGAERRPSVMIAATGLARVPTSIRPIASASVRAGGLLLSGFEMTHGPFDHDQRDRALLQAAVARASVFFEPQPDTPEWEALAWALEAGRPVFGVPAENVPLPERVHLLRDAVDFEWVVAAVLQLT